jgi:hypothetical protein
MVGRERGENRIGGRQLGWVKDHIELDRHHRDIAGKGHRNGGRNRAVARTVADRQLENVGIFGACW